MKLTGKVITIESGDSYTDKVERIVIRFKEADSCYRDIRVPNNDPIFNLNDEVTAEIWLKREIARAAS